MSPSTRRMTLRFNFCKCVFNNFIILSVMEHTHITQTHTHTNTLGHPHIYTLHTHNKCSKDWCSYPELNPLFGDSFWCWSTKHDLLSYGPHLNKPSKSHMSVISLSIFLWCPSPNLAFFQIATSGTTLN